MTVQNAATTIDDSGTTIVFTIIDAYSKLQVITQIDDYLFSSIRAVPRYEYCITDLNGYNDGCWDVTIFIPFDEPAHSPCIKSAILDKTLKLYRFRVVQCHNSHAAIATVLSRLLDEGHEIRELTVSYRSSQTYSVNVAIQ